MLFQFLLSDQVENIFNNSPKNGYKIMFFNVVLLRNDLYQRMIFNIAQQGFHTDPFVNSFCNNDQESQAPPNCMHGLFLAESHNQTLKISRISSSSQQHVLLAGEFRRFFKLYLLSPYLCNFLF